MPPRWRTPATLLLALALLLPAFALPIPARAAGLVVTSLADTSGDPTVRTLRDAIIAANTDAGVGACAAGANTGTDTITFAAGLTGTITLGSNLPPIASAVAITGPGAASLTVDRNSLSGIAFAVNAGGSLDLAALTVRGADNGLALDGNTASATLTNATLSANVIGLAFDGGGTATLTNATLSGNTFGLYFKNGGTATLINATLSAKTIGLRFDGGGAATLINTILAEGTTANCFGPVAVTDGGHNLADDNSCFFGGGLGGSRVVDHGATGLDPNGLQDNGGPTKTIALLPTSPALDAVDPAACPAADQRGVPRPQGAGCDVGAFERLAAPTLAAIQPMSVGAGSGDTTLVLLGTGFTPPPSTAAASPPSMAPRWPPPISRPPGSTPPSPPPR